MIDFDALSIENPESLAHGWQSRTDAGDLLINAVLAIRDSSDERLMLQFTRLAAELEDAGNDDWARFVLQTVLVQVTSAQSVTAASAEDQYLSTTEFDRMILHVAQSSDAPTVLTCCLLTTAGRILGAERRFDDSAAMLGIAANHWNHLSNSTETVRTLLTQGAALNYAHRPQDALEVNARVLQLLETTGDRREIAMVMLNNINNLVELGHLPEATEQVAHVAAIVRELRDGYLSTSLNLNAALLHIAYGDLAQARTAFLKAERSARQRGDFGQLLVAQKNVAKITADSGRPGLSIQWWLRSRDTARVIHDRRAEQEIEHALALSLASLHRYADAVTALERSISVSTTFDDSRAVAHARADLGAVLLTSYVRQLESVDVQADNQLLEQAEQQLLQAKETLEGLTDFEWSELTLRNLRSVWMYLDNPENGVNVLRGTADTFMTSAPAYASAALRNAGILTLGTVSDIDSSTALEWLVLAAGLDVSDAGDDGKDEQAWSMAGDASYLANALALPTEALALFDTALSYLNPLQDPTSWGNIQNDAAIAAAGMDNLDEAIARFSSVIEIAEKTQDRVLTALAVGNMGELLHKRDDRKGASEQFIRAANLLEALGDAEGAANSWAAASRMYILDDLTLEARRAAERASEFAGGFPDAMATALSAHASVLFTENRFDEAYQNWTNAAALVETSEAGEYYAFALDCLARRGDWASFRRLLDKWGGILQRAGAVQAFVGQLHSCVQTWLINKRPKQAGVVLAYMVLLSMDGMSRSASTPHVDRLRPSSMALVPSLTAISTVHLYLEEYEVSEPARSAMRRSYESTIQKLAKDGSENIIRMVDSLFED
ncbi:hypothetical protein [Clavibacter michiganensis]|uniref:hypothetical protein n=1 Tax=Clavibacter michiganensis TaxID=28447 RepID=UPI0011B07BAE|nr:hypothetical protein [Clavibacter michiganensis]